MKTNYLFFLYVILPFLGFAQFNFSIEAEAAVLGGTYEVKSNGNASNGDFVKLTIDNPKGVLSFEVLAVPTTGIYKLEVFTFNGGTPQTLNMKVNESTAEEVILEASNWAFEGAAKATVFDVELNQGTNTIQFEITNTTVLLDFFKVTENYTAYYFSTEGNDETGDGSLANPWQSIAKATAISETENNGGIMQPGDKMLFRSGDRFEGHLIVKCSGTSENMIEISSYGTGEYPILSGSGDIAGGDYFQAITLTNTSNLLMTKLHIQNDRKNGERYTYGEYTGYGVVLKANKWGGIASNVIFRNMKVSNVFGLTIPSPSEFNSLQATGIRLDSDANEEGLTVGIEDVLIEDCYFTNIGKAGVWAKHSGTLDDDDATVNRSKNIVVRNNTFYQTGGSGVIFSKVYNGLIENNDFDHTGHSNDVEDRLAGRGSGAWVFSCDNIIAQYNRSYSVRGPNDSYGIHIDFGNENIIFQYNYSEDSEGGFCEILGDNINSVYRFNVSYNDCKRDFHGSTLWISDYAGSGKPGILSEENYIYNNTIYIDKAQNPDISIEAKNTYVYNNIFMAINGGEIGEKVEITIDPSSQLYVSNNLFQGNVNTEFSNLDANSVLDWPLFTDPGISKNKEGYVLQETSAAIDAGLSFPQPSFPNAGVGIFSHISQHPTEDAFGVDVNVNDQIPNIGASNLYNTTLSVNSFAALDFKLFPNPVKNTMNFSFAKQQGILHVEVFDVTGGLVFKEEVLINGTSLQLNLPSTIRNGIYQVKIKNNNKYNTITFVLAR